MPIKCYNINKCSVRTLSNTLELLLISLPCCFFDLFLTLLPYLKSPLYLCLVKPFYPQDSVLALFLGSTLWPPFTPTLSLGCHTSFVLPNALHISLSLSLSELTTLYCSGHWPTWLWTFWKSLNPVPLSTLILTWDLTHALALTAVEQIWWTYSALSIVLDFLAPSSWAFFGGGFHYSRQGPEEFPSSDQPGYLFTQSVIQATTYGLVSSLALKQEDVG